MSAGWVLVQTDGDAVRPVADALAAMSGVEAVDATAGAYDVVARVRDAGPDVPSARRVARAALTLPGVTLAVCCHENGTGEPDAAGGGTTREIDLTDSRGARDFVSH